MCVLSKEAPAHPWRGGDIERDRGVELEQAAGYRLPATHVHHTILHYRVHFRAAFGHSAGPRERCQISQRVKLAQPSDGGKVENLEHSGSSGEVEKYANRQLTNSLRTNHRSQLAALMTNG